MLDCNCERVIHTPLSYKIGYNRDMRWHYATMTEEEITSLKILNEVGDAGWELCGIAKTDEGNIYYFKKFVD